MDASEVLVLFSKWLKCDPKGYFNSDTLQWRGFITLHEVVLAFDRLFGRALSITDALQSDSNSSSLTMKCSKYAGAFLSETEMRWSVHVTRFSITCQYFAKQNLHLITVFYSDCFNWTFHFI